MSSLRNRLLSSLMTPLGQALILGGLLMPAPAGANPEDGQVVAGHATISQTSPVRTDITQQTDRAIIDWRAFSIGAGESVHFDQPNAQAIALNRVIGGDPSAIFGDLIANGQVWLINPNGVAFGPSARVDVAGLLATTLDIDNADFMAGNYRFADNGLTGARISNAGTITVADRGLAALVAPGVDNSGVIQARLGHIQLSAASGFTLDLYGDGLFNFLLDGQVTQSMFGADSVRLEAAVSNSGSLYADGGRVFLTADVASTVVDRVVNMDGYIQARSIGSANGEVVLEGGEGGVVRVAGSIDVSGAQSGQTGGSVSILGQDTEFSSAARINATGNIHGGDAEVSGYRRLVFEGQVDLRAAHGEAGTLLLDPENLTIAAIGATPSLPGAGPVTLVGNGDNSVLAVSTLQTALSLGNVIVATGAGGAQAGDITVATDVSWSGNNSLTLSAHRNVVVNDGITVANSGAGDLVFHADSDGTGTGTVIFDGTGRVDFGASSGDVFIFYNPVDYAHPTNYVGNVSGSAPIAYMLVISPSNLDAVRSNLSGTYALGRDINASSLAGFVPIGDGTTPWTGTFFGDGHSITALTIHSTLNYVGLFGLSFGTINDLTLAGVNITANGSGSLTVGGVVGRNEGTITDAHVGGNVASVGSGTVHIGGVAGDNIGTVSGSSSAAAVATGHPGGNCCALYTYGGLVGFNYGLIEQSASTGTVQGDGGDGGGLAGYNHGTISQSYATGAVDGGAASIAGGLVGWNQSGSIVQSYARGNVDGGAGGLAGGLVELLDLGGSVTQSYATGNVSGFDVRGLVNRVGFGGGSVSNSYWDTQTSGTVIDGGGAIGRTTAQLMAGLPAGFDPAVWAIDPSINNGYPHLRWQFPAAAAAGTSISFGAAPPGLANVQNQLVALSDFRIAGTTPAIPAIAGTPAPNASQIMSQVPFQLATKPAITEFVNLLFEAVPWALLNSAERDRFVNVISSKLTEIANRPASDLNVPAVVLGLVLDSMIETVHDSYQGKVPPIVLEIVTYSVRVAGAVGLDAATQAATTGQVYPHLAALRGTISATTSEIIDTVEALVSLQSEQGARLATVEQLMAQADALTSLARDARADGDLEEFRRLSAFAVDLYGIAAELAEGSSGYSNNGNILTAFWDSLW